MIYLKELASLATLGAVIAGPWIGLPATLGYVVTFTLVQHFFSRVGKC